ncbi:MAG: HAMP domain-containing sensor histidine kinase, partial [Spirochaetales bacterium]|nr:HAMP domain-containing sensor histidine kinase [Spirochaetales bacterium]
LHILCHDLANPFASIISALSVIREDAGVLDELLPAVEDSAERGMDIISMVKKHRSLKLKGIILEEIDLKSAWDEACRGIIHMAEAKNISLVPLEGSEKYQILAEEVSLVNTVLVNILSNALKFSSGGSAVRVETEASGDRVILSIIDEGIGIPEEILSRLFDAHARDTHRRGTNGETGTGFGMPLVKSMMEYYGGDIQVTSTPGEGTRVSLRFRRA